MAHKYGIVCEFNDPSALMNAAQKVRDAGYKKFDVYSPFPIHGMDEAMGMSRSKLPWVVLGCGLTGASCGFALQTWVATSAYRLTISGKPFFSYQAFVPVIFELMVLFSAFGAVFGMFIMNGLPQWYHSVFHHSQFHKMSSHGFFLSIEAKDPLYHSQQTVTFLESIGAKSVEIVDE